MKRILVIEDEAPLRLTLTGVLRKRGFVTLEAGSGAEGLALARRELPDLVLSDLNLGSDDGLDVLKTLRAEPATQSIPVILMTGVTERANIRQGMVLGADDFLVKPFPAEDLLATVEARLQREVSAHRHVRAHQQKRKESENALSVERDLLQALMDNLPDCVYFKDADSRFTRVNASQARLLGLTSPQEAIGKSDMDYFPLQFARQTLTDERLMLATGQALIDHLEQLTTEAGVTTWLSATKAPIRNADGEVIGLVGVTRDITERRRGEERLARINECFLRFGEDVQENIRQMTALAGELFNAERAIYTHLEGGKRVALEKSTAGSVNQTQLEPLLAFMEKGLGDKLNRDLFLVRDVASEPGADPLSGCGLNSMLTWVGLPVRLGKTPVGCLNLFYAGVFTPTPACEKVLGILSSAIRVEEERWKSQSERQTIETQLRQAQKLEAIGQLAAGIAHEINTPTQYVGDNTRFLQDSFKSIQAVLATHTELLAAAKANNLTPQLLARAEQVAAAGDLDYIFEQVPVAINETLEGVGRITRIVRAMKEFSHPGGKEKAAADLNKAIESTVTVARNEWKYVAEMKLDLAPDLPPVPCFVGEFNQAVLNLVINAAHAIQDALKQRAGEKGMITVRTRREGSDVEVRISDTGTGIPEAVRPRIFEPFFTTKELGKGTGQGLSIVYGSIVKKHGGSVRFETETGKGTTFILRLPLASKEGNGKVPAKEVRTDRVDAIRAEPNSTTPAMSPTAPQTNRGAQP